MMASPKHAPTRNLGNRDLAPHTSAIVHPNWILGSTSDKHNAPNWQSMLSLDNVDMGCNGIRDAFQGGANHMGSRMPSGQAKEDATRLGIVERSTLPRKVRQTHEPIAPGATSAASCAITEYASGPPWPSASTASRYSS